MVYTKDDGSYGFNWQQQYDFLLKEHPEDLENIVQSKFSLLKTQQPGQAEYYEELEEELAERIGEAWDNNPDYGYKDSDKVVKDFIKDKRLEELFGDVPTLLNQDDIDDINLDFEDDDIDDYLTEI